MADSGTGSLSVLNVGEGDIVLTFNEHDPHEREKAVRMLVDMQRRGYAILIRLPDNTYVRAQAIDAQSGCYVIQVPDGLDLGGMLAETPVMVEAGGLPDYEALPSPDLPALPPGNEAEPSADSAPKRRGRPVKVPIEKVQAVGVARSAGG